MSIFERRSQSSSTRIGVQISSSVISVAHVRVGVGQTPTLIGYRETPAKAGALTRLIKEMSLQGRECYLVLDVADYSLITVEAPKVAETELRNAIKWQIKGLIDLPIEQAVFDVFPAPEGNARRSSNVFVVSAASALINTQVQMAKDAGLKLIAVDIKELALRNLLRVLPLQQAGVVAVTVSGQSMLISIYQEGQLYLSRHVAMDDEASRFAAESPAAAFAHLQEQITAEISRALDYYDRHYSMGPASMMLVWPSNVITAEQSEHFSELFGVSLLNTQITKSIHLPPDINLTLYPAALATVGAAMRGASA